MNEGGHPRRDDGRSLTAFARTMDAVSDGWEAMSNMSTSNECRAKSNEYSRQEEIGDGNDDYRCLSVISKNEAMK